MGLNALMLDALVFIEQIYYEEGKVPTSEAIAATCGLRIDDVREYWKNESFVAALGARGISTDQLESTKALTMPQLLMANMLMNPSDRRSMRQKVKDPSVASYDLSVQQVNGWLRSKTFQDHIQKRAEALFGHAEPAAYTNFVAAIEAGDQKSIQLYFEMKGIYNPRLQVDVNISSVLVRIVEIVSKHVKDPAILSAIATEMDGLDIGNNNSGMPMALPPVGILDSIFVPTVEETEKAVAGNVRIIPTDAYNI